MDSLIPKLIFWLCWWCFSTLLCQLHCPIFVCVTRVHEVDDAILWWMFSLEIYKISPIEFLEREGGGGHQKVHWWTVSCLEILIINEHQGWIGGRGGLKHLPSDMNLTIGLDKMITSSTPLKQRSTALYACTLHNKNASKSWNCRSRVACGCGY